MYSAYMEIGEKIIGQQPHLQISLDQCPKTEAVLFGYVLFDFRDFETIQLWSDEISKDKLDRWKEFHEVAQSDLHHLRQTKLSFDLKENIRVFR